MEKQRIIVIGAGVSGLACSQELKQRGYDVLVIEARSRVGGRLKGESLEMGGGAPGESNFHVDVGGALIHGCDDNPMYDITSQMGVPVHPITSHCLLMDENGWPFDPKKDVKMNNYFNECLDVAFALAEKDRNSTDSFGTLFERVCREKNSSNGTIGRNKKSIDNNKSSNENNAILNGRNGTSAALEKNKTSNCNSDSLNYNNDWENPLLKWYRANLELPSGASFYDLGNTWNEDEPYGFEGIHAAVEPSWKIVMEQLAKGLDILQSSPVSAIRVVLPDGTTPIAIPERIKDLNNDENVDKNNNSNSGNVNENIKSNSCTNSTSKNSNTVDTSTDNTIKNNSIVSEVTYKNEKENAIKNINKTRPSIKRKKQPTKLINALPQFKRFSRRIRDLDVDVRRSSRSNKGVIGKKLEVGHNSKKRKRRKVMSEEDQNKNDNDRKKVTEKIKIPSSTVQVTLHNGTVLEADACVCTLPLGILKLPPNQPGNVQFFPTLSKTKTNAINALGCGLLNKCVISFPIAFWQDSDFFGQAEPDYSYLVLNAMKYTKKPILIFMYGGDFAREIEDWSDTEIISDCLNVLKKLCGRRELPSPTDYCITRWGQEQYSKMAFTYIPPGVDGKRTLSSLSQPVLDPILPEKPLIMFAGEHTTPYHPSTMHGAFLSGIRESYRFDLFMEPALNKFMEFQDDVHVYQHTFRLERLYKKNTIKSPKTKTIQRNGQLYSLRDYPTSNQKHLRRRCFGGMSLRDRPKTTKVIKKVATPTKTKTIASPDITPTRRSQRSNFSVRKASNMLSPTKANTKTTGDDDDMKDTTSKQLLRALESYGNDYNLLQKVVLPVYGSTKKCSAKQICDRWQRLVSTTKKRPDLVSSWRAKRIVKDDWDTHIARLAAERDLLLDTTKESSSARRSRRSGKARSFVDM